MGRCDLTNREWVRLESYLPAARVAGPPISTARSTSAATKSSARSTKNSQAVATRYDKRAYVVHGTVTTAAIRLWLRP